MRGGCGSPFALSLRSPLSEFLIVCQVQLETPSSNVQNCAILYFTLPPCHLLAEAAVGLCCEGYYNASPVLDSMKVSLLFFAFFFLESSASWQPLHVPRTSDGSYRRSARAVSDAQHLQPAFVGAHLHMNQHSDDEEKTKEMSQRFEDFLNSDDDFFEIASPKKDSGAPAAATPPPVLPAPKQSLIPPLMPAPRKPAAKQPPQTMSKDMPPSKKELSDYDAYLASENMPPTFGGNASTNKPANKVSGKKQQNAFAAFLDSGDTFFESHADVETPVEWQNSAKPETPPAASPVKEDLAAYDAYLASENTALAVGGNPNASRPSTENKTRPEGTFAAFLASDEKFFDNRADPEKAQLKVDPSDQLTQILNPFMDPTGAIFSSPAGILLEGTPVPIDDRSSKSPPAVPGGGRSSFMALLESTDTTFQGRHVQTPMSLEEAMNVDLYDTQELTDDLRRAMVARDEQLQAALSAHLDQDEQGDRKKLARVQAGRILLEAEVEANQLHDDQIASIRAMILADNPVDGDDGQSSDVAEQSDERNTRVVKNDDRKGIRVSNLKESRPYIVAFSAGVVAAIVGRRLLALLLGRGML